MLCGQPVGATNDQARHAIRLVDWVAVAGKQAANWGVAPGYSWTASVERRMASRPLRTTVWSFAICSSSCFRLVSA